MQLATGQLAVVTGAASGIGAAVAGALVDRGLRVVLADVEAEALEVVRTALARRGAVDAVVVDVADAAAVRDRLGALPSPCDLLVANAGVVGPVRPVWDQAADDWEWVLGVNLLGTVNVLTAVLPAMVARGVGHVALTASTAGLMPMAGGGNGPYAASKHALVGIADVLREDLRTAGADIGVTTFCPGPVATRIRDAARNRPAHLAVATPTPTPAFTHEVATISAAQAAAVLLDAVEGGQPLALPNPGSAAEALAHQTGRLIDACTPDPVT